jgi:hypothetical protein
MADSGKLSHRRLRELLVVVLARARHRDEVDDLWLAQFLNIAMARSTKPRAWPEPKL